MGVASDLIGVEMSDTPRTDAFLISSDGMVDLPEADHVVRFCRELECENNDLRAKLAAEEKDAAWYRWPRNQKVTFLFDLGNHIKLSQENLRPRTDVPDQIDAAIDAAIAMKEQA